MKNSVQNTTNGRYTLGGTTEVSPFAIEWWEKNQLVHANSDITYYIEKKYEGRPDLLGFVFYGDSALWWVIAQYNGILDPLEELVEGKLLLIPLLSRVKSELFTSNVKAGGTPTTR